MKSIFGVTIYTVKLLIRDKIFIPAGIIGSMLLILAGAASGWTVENYERILYDIGFAGFHFTGAIVALLWGSKMLGDYKTDGSIELDLSSPLSRPAWFFAKYFGLIVVLILLAAALIVAWQGVLYYFDFSAMSLSYFLVFLVFVLEWMVLGAAAFFFSSFASGTTSLFLTLVAWVVGLISEPIYFATRHSSEGLVKALSENLYTVWNFQRFNLSEVTMSGQIPEGAALQYAGIYALSLIVLFIVSGSAFFSKKQLY